MGHSRIGTLPQTRWWDEIVDLIATGANVQNVADTMLRAAQKALGTVVNDAGFREAMYLAVQLALAGREKNAVETGSEASACGAQERLTHSRRR